jgi:hypothetical protein
MRIAALALACACSSCDKLDFHPPKKPGNPYRDAVVYTGYSLLRESVELGTGGVGSADVHETVNQVVQTNQNHVLVGGERWYLNEAACRAAKP